MDWNNDTQDKFKLMISRMPIFHRRIAESAVIKKAIDVACGRGAKQVEDVDVVEAFFSEVPKPFYSLMIRLLENSGFDYTKR